MTPCRAGDLRLRGMVIVRWYSSDMRKIIPDLKRAFMLAICLATSSAATAAAPSIDLGKIHSQGLTRSQARQVLVFVLTREGYGLKKRGVFIEDLTGDDGRLSPPGHVSFGLSYDTPKQGATAIWGLFAVSVSTGEMWEINTCEKFSFPALLRIQAAVRAATNISEAHERIERRGLGCTD